MVVRQTVALGVCLSLALLQARADDKAPAQSGSAASAWVLIGTQGGGMGPPGGAPPGAAPGGAQAPTSGQPPAGSAGGPSGPQGIYVARLDEKTGQLSALNFAVELQRSDWVTVHPKLPVIYAVAVGSGGMRANSEIYSLSLDPASGKLQILNHVDAGGSDATHLDLDAKSNTLLSANHGSGTVTALPIIADGSLGPVASTGKNYGTGPTRRQQSPAAHSVVVDSNHHFVLSADFGADRVFVYHIDAATRMLTPADPPFEQLPAGSGPRHMALDPKGHFLFLDTELTAEVRSYRWDSQSGHLKLIQATSAYPADYSSKEDKSSAELAVSHDGRFLYVSLRGDQNSLVAYAIDQKAGTFKEIQRLSAQGVSPWSFGIDPTGTWLLVTNVGSGTVTEFKIDHATGKLSPTDQMLTVPRAVTVAFYRQ